MVSAPLDVTKPFSIEELIARVRAVLREHGVSQGGSRLLTVADLELDDDAHDVRREGEVPAMTTTEYRLLRYPMVNAGRVLSAARFWTTVQDQATLEFTLQLARD